MFKLFILQFDYNICNKNIENESVLYIGRREVLDLTY